MKFEWDDAKSRRNVEERGVSFELARVFELDESLRSPDDRKDYGEERMVALGLIGARVYSMVYTIRGDTLRVISLRKANKREVRRYVARI